MGETHPESVDIREGLRSAAENEPDPGLRERRLLREAEGPVTDLTPDRNRKLVMVEERPARETLREQLRHRPFAHLPQPPKPAFIKGRAS